MTKEPQTEAPTSQWLRFAHEEALTKEQTDFFKNYSALLLTWNKKFNLTALKNERDIIDFHFKDSLRVGEIIDLPLIMHCADIGSGAGFPGIPLAIKYSHLAVTLIEVNTKKIQFLTTLIAELGLHNRVAIVSVDWRTFLRTTQEDIQLFCARASLQSEELMRMFKPASVYKHAYLVYWASQKWLPSALVEQHIVKEFLYTIRGKKRRLILFQDQKA